ncbi:unnamed protein product [Litomosoides sigmodontis]|uniref:Ig-like domain-containing protein n=1 Tax=Litomosoides sigmodontis TaxID=42156 RepID=A0A3P6VCA8_LITSI|nr:unnamed protein product [Litomosoides sigmodontis]
MGGCLIFVLFITELCNGKNQHVELSSIRTTIKPLGRLDLLECAVLEPTEYDKHVAKGSCPPQPTKILKAAGIKLRELYFGKSAWLVRKEKKEKKDWLVKKRFIMKTVFLGKQSFYQLRLQNVDFDFELIEGLFLILECPTRSKPKIEWYLDGSLIITDSRLSWRVKLASPEYLQIWPLMVTRDEGRYECFIDGKSHGSVTLHVITVAEGVSRGTVNYFITMMLSIPFVAFAIFYRFLHPQREAIMLDSPITDFYEKILDLATEEMKSHITTTICKETGKIKQQQIMSIHSSKKTLSGMIARLQQTLLFFSITELFILRFR